MTEERSVAKETVKRVNTTTQQPNNKNNVSRQYIDNTSQIENYPMPVFSPMRHLVTIRISEDLKGRLQQRTTKEGRDLSSLTRQLWEGWLRTPSQEPEQPIPTVNVSLQAPPTKMISGKLLALQRAVAKAKEILATTGIVPGSLKHEILRTVKSVSVSEDLAQDIQALLDAPEAKMK